MILVLVGPSCCGKTTQAKILMEKYNFIQSISYTSRAPRNNEKNNVDYKFIDQNDFIHKIKNNFFLEYTKQFDNYYGTSKEDIEQIIQKNNVVMCLCINGFKATLKQWGDKVTGIYLMPPTKEQLQKRFDERNSSKSEVNKRINNILTIANNESVESHYIIAAKSIEETTLEILKILKNK